MVRVVRVVRVVVRLHCGAGPFPCFHLREKENQCPVVVVPFEVRSGSGSGGGVLNCPDVLWNFFSRDATFTCNGTSSPLKGGSSNRSSYMPDDFSSFLSLCYIWMQETILMQPSLQPGRERALLCLS